ncbi:MAG: hypothetical protein HYR56_32680 [Acidobacteria bacterium]|nr:hypothetical protein [Acidobacteriota bacterium]MBI3426125.1 hypothetical protein [Acidobacteriota bacterium]
MVNREEVKQLVRAAIEQALPIQPAVYQAPWTGVTYDAHPSRQQFDINEATDLRRELREFVEEQLCTIERNRKCDHCGVCRSLGY